MGSVGTGAHNYLRFDKLPKEKGHKLHKYCVFNHSLYEDIGIIHWRGGWRKYVFTAINHCDRSIVKINGKKYLPIESLIDIDMSIGCHEKINEFIRKLMKEWKNEQKNTKTRSRTEQKEV